MKYLSFIPVFITLAFANNNGCTETGSAVNPQVTGSDGITLTVVNNWTVADQVIGIDIIEGSSIFYVNAVCNEEDLLRAL